MSRIKCGSRVSTEALRLDTKDVANKHWSYLQFGGKWMDSQAYRTVINKSGDKWTVCWDIDNEEILLESDFLQKKAR